MAKQLERIENCGHCPWLRMKNPECGHPFGPGDINWTEHVWGGRDPETDNKIHPKVAEGCPLDDAPEN